MHQLTELFCFQLPTSTCEDQWAGLGCENSHRYSSGNFYLRVSPVDSISCLVIRENNILLPLCQCAYRLSPLSPFSSACVVDWLISLVSYRYIGELISDSEADRREDDSYLFDLDNKVGYSVRVTKDLLQSQPRSKGDSGHSLCDAGTICYSIWKLIMCPGVLVLTLILKVKDLRAPFIQIP